MKLKEEIIEKSNVFEEIAKMEERISRISYNLKRIKAKSSEFRNKTLNFYKENF